MKKENNQLAITLLDSVFEIIEIYKPESPSQEEWKRWWLENANNLINEYVENKKHVLEKMNYDNEK